MRPAPDEPRDRFATPPPPRQYHGALVREMRRIREEAGLTYARLARHTDYSRASWTRFLTGRCLPPRQAVLSLTALGEAPADPLLVLWELAHREEAEAERPAGTRCDTADPVDDDPGRPESLSRPEETVPGRGTRFPRSRVAVAVTVVAAITGAGLGLSAVSPHTSRDAAGPPSSATEQGPSCRFASCTGAYPAERGCLADAVVLNSEWVEHKGVDLVHSGACGAAWARARREPDGALLRVSDAGGRSADGTVRGRHAVSRMLGVRTTTGLLACLTLVGGASTCADSEPDPAPRP